MARPALCLPRAVAVVAAFCIAAGGCAQNPTERPYKIPSGASVADPQFTRMMGSLLGPPIITGNSATTLVNGERIFPAMLQSIRSAQKTIDFESYVYWSSKIGSDFADALAERAARGVKVHVMVDSFGSGKINRAYIQKMQQAGVTVVRYHPLRWYSIPTAQKLNNRTHRKLLIVDGTSGFTGGVGIADEWSGDADSKEHWRDTHYLVKGPVVAQLQAVFADHWMETTGEVLQGDDYFPPLPDAGKMSAQVFKSSPRGGSESMELMYLLSIAAARKNIRLANAYFVPDHLTIQTLLEARKRGVSIQVMLPGPLIDEKVVRRASRARWGELLRAGVEIYEYQSTMFHCKLMTVDDRWVSIGSTNLDNWSFRLNDEANMNVMDEQFAAEQTRMFEQDLQRCKRISYEQWQHRPLWEKLGENFATIFGFVL